MHPVLDEKALHQALINDKDIDPLLLSELRDSAMLQEAVGSHYDLEELNTGKILDRGKIKLKRKAQGGGSDLKQTIDALLMAAASQKYGNVVEGTKTSPYSNELRMAAERILAPAGASELAKVGLRDGDLAKLSGREKLERALDRILELDKGYNPVTGSLYEGVDLDGGHKMAHSKYGDMSSNKDNMMFESKYENRTKGNKEGDSLIKALRSSLLNRLKKGRITPEELAKAYQFDDSIIGPEAGEDMQATGSVVGQKPFVINADEGANVYIHTNGNGNGENHAIMQEKFNRRRR